MVYIDQPSKMETWTVTSDCVSPIQCTGEVRSDAGWTGSLTFNGDSWMVDRDIPNWQPCPDGTAATGHQNFALWGFDPTTSEKNEVPGPDRGPGKDDGPERRMRLQQAGCHRVAGATGKDS